MATNNSNGRSTRKPAYQVGKAKRFIVTGMIDNELNERLKAYQARYGVNVSETIREALEALLPKIRKPRPVKKAS